MPFKQGERWRGGKEARWGKTGREGKGERTAAKMAVLPAPSGPTRTIVLSRTVLVCDQSKKMPVEERCACQSRADERERRKDRTCDEGEDDGGEEGEQGLLVIEEAECGWKVDRTLAHGSLARLKGRWAEELEGGVLAGGRARREGKALHVVTRCYADVTQPLLGCAHHRLQALSPSFLPSTPPIMPFSCTYLLLLSYGYVPSD